MSENTEESNIEQRFSMGMPRELGCGSCRYWLGTQYLGDPKVLGECHRHAPNVLQRHVFFADMAAEEINWSNRNFPETYFSDWCGDWQEQGK